MLDTALGQEMTYGQARLTSADHNDVVTFQF